MLRSSLSLLPVALVVAFSTGCAGKLRSNTGLSLRAQVAAPSIQLSGYGNGSAQASGNAWAQGTAYGQGNWQGNAHGQGNAYGQGNWQGNGCGQGNASAQTTVNGNARPSAPAPVAFAPLPVFFGVPLGGAQDVVFVLDRSGSMTSSIGGGWSAPSSPLAALATLGLQAATTAQSARSLVPQNGQWLNAFQAISTTPTKIDAAKSELIGALGALPDGTRFNIVFFNEGSASLSQQMVTMNAMSRLHAISFVHGIQADGITAAVPALRTAYSSRPYRVVFLSDGLANTGGTPQDLLAEARVEMRRGVRFDTVGIGSDQDAALMQALAQESGGVAMKR